VKQKTEKDVKMRKKVRKKMRKNMMNNVCKICKFTHTITCNTKEIYEKQKELSAPKHKRPRRNMH